MKEKNIIDFDKVEKNGGYINDDDKRVDCNVSYIHKKAYEKLKPIQEKVAGVPVFGFSVLERNIIPLCPKCGKPLTRGDGYDVEHDVIVSETDYPLPDSDIGYYELWSCEDCVNNEGTTQMYAMIPIPVIYNTNYNIFHTGGRQYTSDKDVEKLIDDIFDSIKPEIQTHIDRKLNPKMFIDKHLQDFEWQMRCKDEIESIICNYMYEKGYKK